MSGLFRAWKPTAKGKDPEIQRLEKDAEETRQKIAALREQGRQRRNHRLQSLDALETRRMTLLEILKRMDKELADKDVDDYADVLAEAFGERKIFAHRAIGLEALLCQFMHQMLAKQHQLKIIKKSGKDLQKFFQGHRNQNREEFHSYEALAVHLETMRLSLEAQYDDIFAAQHSLLARLHHVEAGGTMTNYKVVKPATEKAKKKPTLSVSKKHAPSPHKTSTPTHDTGESDDDNVLMQSILSGKDAENGQNDVGSNDSPSKPPVSPRKSSNQRFDGGGSTGSAKSARDRRREIEQNRLASGRGSSSNNTVDETDKDKAREKMRELEAKRANKDSDGLQERQSTRRSKRCPASSPKSDASFSSEMSSSALSKEDEEEARRRRRQERRNSRAAARAASTASS